MAQAKDGVFTWIHADHLSSATRITDVNGLEVRRLAYTSFGEEAENQGAGDEPKYTYTGKEADATGLYYSGARYYDPALSRFITADTVYDAGPQGLNRYSYALNNPILYRDPSGNASEDSDKGWENWEQELAQNIENHLAKLDLEGLESEERKQIIDEVIIHQAQKLQRKYGAKIATARILPWGRLAYEKLRPLYTRFPNNKGIQNENLNALTEGIEVGAYTAVTEAAGEATGELLVKGLKGVSKTTLETVKSRYPKQYNQYLKLTNKRLKKAIKTHDKQIAKHEAWLKDPKSKVNQWDKLSKQHQENILHHWQQDIERHKAYKTIAEEILKER